jgi:hypothetical protein
VTSQQNVEIQALINGIDEVLSKNAPRLPWVMSNDALQQRQVLEQARQYLTSLQQAEANQRLQAAPSQSSSFSTGQVLDQTSGQASAESAQQVLQAVLQEMNYWRANMLQPLRTEIDSLQRQRELLSLEVQQLEGRRQALGQTLSGASGVQNQQLMEFLQAAMGQMQANLSAQVTQMIANLPEQSSLPPAIQLGQAALPAADRQIAQTQFMQAQSDQLMLKLDSTLQIIFESLNRNIQTYQESMEQGLGRMHHLGEQGEAMFTFLVNRLSQQLGREATSFLQSGADLSNQAQIQAQPAAPSSSPRLTGSSSSPDSPLPDSPFKVADFLSQVPEPRSIASFVPAVPFNLLEEVLDIADLDPLDATDLALEALPADPLPSGLGAELNQLQLEGIPDAASNLPGLEAEAPFDLFSGTQPLLVATGNSFTAGRFMTDSALASSDLDSALDLLNQLSAEMQSGSAIEVVDERYGDTDVVADLAADLAAAPELSTEPALIAALDSLYDDAFYGSSAQETPTSSAFASAVPAPELADSMTLEQAWFDGLGDPAFQSIAQSSAVPAPSESISRSLESVLPDSLSEDKATEDKAAEDKAAESNLFASLSTPPTPRPEAKSDFEQSLQTLIQESSFEAMSVSEAPDEAVDLGMTLDSLAQLGSSVEPQVEPQVAPQVAQMPPANPPTVTIEGLEGLFEDLPDRVPSAAAQSQVEVITDLFSQIGAADPFTESDLASDSAAEKKNF